MIIFSKMSKCSFKEFPSSFRVIKQHLHVFCHNTSNVPEITLTLCIGNFKLENSVFVELSQSLRERIRKCFDDVQLHKQIYVSDQSLLDTNPTWEFISTNESPVSVQPPVQVDMNPQGIHLMTLHSH